MKTRTKSRKARKAAKPVKVAAPATTTAATMALFTAAKSVKAPPSIKATLPEMSREELKAATLNPATKLTDLPQPRQAAKVKRIWFQLATTPVTKAKVEMLKAKLGLTHGNDLAAFVFEEAFERHGIKV